jgi:hypothetical protein
MGTAMVLPWFVPGVMVSFGLAVATARPLGRALSARPAVAWLLVLALGAIAAATLTPLGGTLHRAVGAARSCDLARTWPAPASLLLRDDDASLNVALFIPLGIAIARLPRSRIALLIALGAVTLPFVIEATQLVVPALGRGCESADAVDNLTGLALGLVAASLVAGLAAAVHSHGPVRVRSASPRRDPSSGSDMAGTPADGRATRSEARHGGERPRPRMR